MLKVYVCKYKSKFIESLEIYNSRYGFGYINLEF